VRYVSDRMAVMYLGTVVECGPSDEVFFNPQHPYTKLLIESNPEPDPKAERARQHASIKGEITSPINMGPGCRFADRCPSATARCSVEDPKTTQISDQHSVTCNLFD
jgi:oligopeptide transport system ATP-binding protein